ncbi:MAG: hypothetical protein V3V49_13140 [Candidatus Krumholzibacteria bacterium]
MNQFRGSNRFVRALVCFVPGSMLLGGSCTSDIRESILAAGQTFASQATTTVLEAIFPVDDLVSAITDAPAE